MKNTFLLKGEVNRSQIENFDSISNIVPLSPIIPHPLDSHNTFCKSFVCPMFLSNHQHSHKSPKIICVSSIYKLKKTTSPQHVGIPTPYAQKMCNFFHCPSSNIPLHLKMCQITKQSHNYSQQKTKHVLDS